MDSSHSKNFEMNADLGSAYPLLAASTFACFEQRDFCPADMFSAARL